MDRKNFLNKIAISCLGVTGLSFSSSHATNRDNVIFNYDEIEEFVFAAHADFEKTKQILDAKPLILNATNQFKKGDFETALGGASHMGRKDIASMLLDRGARQDIFTLAYFGESDVVMRLIEKSPELIKAPGPHGFTLLHHAKVGKNTDLVQWLQDRGLIDDIFKGVFSE